jgi:hypothetical protein
MRRAMRSLVLLLGALLSTACREHAAEPSEGQRVKEAVESFVDFSLGRDRGAPAARERRDRGPKVRQRRVDATMTPRLRLEVDIELPFDLRGPALEQALLDAARHLLADTEYQAVRVRAWPGPLGRFAGLMGTSVVAPDGQGWDGQKLAYREVKVALRAGAACPTAEEYKVLVALEAEAARLQPDGTLNRPNRRRAAASVARALGVGLAVVERAATRAADCYARP